jgi:general stress protein YciG
MNELRTKSRRGFAAMSPEEQREIARMGGRSVPATKRAFFTDRSLAAKAGRKGGQSVPGESRSYFRDRQLASDAGRRGGQHKGA